MLRSMNSPLPGLRAPQTKLDATGNNIANVNTLGYKSSTTEFMSQTATFTQLEKLEEIAAQNASLVALQRSLSAGALVGHTVSYTDEKGATVTGTVGSVKISGDEPSAVVDGVDVPIGRLTEVSLPGTR